MNNSIKINPIKGRALLHWIGKKAPQSVQDFPAQLVESFNTKSPPRAPTWQSSKKEWCNILLHGDNIEVLSMLIAGGFRGKIDLIYIDPPFASGVDYTRKVSLRGSKERILGEKMASIEEKQYEDIWADDTYLQCMYERLVLIHEMLSEQGSIYLHCDWHKSHHLRFLMDEVFGKDNFVNEIIWRRKRGSSNPANIGNSHDTLFRYSKTAVYTFNQIYLPYDKNYLDKTYTQEDENGKYRRHDLVASPNLGGTSPRFEYKGFTPSTRWLVKEETVKELDAANRILWSKEGVPCRKLYQSEGVPLTSIWNDIPNVQGKQKSGYPTQKPIALLERIIKSSSNEGDLVADFFCGSGTTAVVAEHLGRKWIACDMNKSAVKTTIERLLKPNITKLILEKNKKIKEKKPSCPPHAFIHCRVNNYDFQEQNAKREIIEEKYGVRKIPSELFFDGVSSEEELIKIAPLNRPMSANDIEDILVELKNRPHEDRRILLIGYGSEHSVRQKEKECNHNLVVKRVRVHDIQQDNIIASSYPEADIDFKQIRGKVEIVIKNFISTTIMQRLKIIRSDFDEDIFDFRSIIDIVLIDNNYNYKVFSPVIEDIPENECDLIKGFYSVEKPYAKSVIAIKIVDRRGEETFDTYPCSKKKKR